MIYCFLFYSVVLCSICFPESSFMNLTSLSYGDSDNRIEVNKTNMGVSLSEENYPETFTDNTRLTTSNLSTDISTHRETQGNVNRSEFELLKTEDEHVMLKEMDNNQTIHEKDSIRKTTELPALLNLSTTSADTTEEALVNESNKISYTNSTSSQTEVVSNSYKDFSEKSVDEATFESRDTKFNPMVNSTIPWDMTKANTQKSVRHEKFSGTAKLLTTTPKHHRHKPYRHSYHQMLHHKTMHHLSLGRYIPLKDTFNGFPSLLTLTKLRHSNIKL